MSFKPIRSFLETRLLEIDSDFEAHNDAFSTENIGANDFDKRYHIFYGNVTTSVSNQVTTQDDVTVTVKLYFDGYRDATESLDSAMDTANLFRIQCLKINYLINQSFIKRVVCNSIQANPLNTNDNAIEVVLTFNVRVIFGLGADLDCN